MHFRASGVVSTWMRSAATTAHRRPASSSAHRSWPTGRPSRSRDRRWPWRHRTGAAWRGRCQHGAGKPFGGQVPDPRGAVADDDALGCGVETASYGLTIGPLCEGGRRRVGVAAGRASDRGVVADRPAVAAGAALCVAPFGRPHGGQFDLAGLGRAVGLFPAASFDLGRAHRQRRSCPAPGTSSARAPRRSAR